MKWLLPVAAMFFATLSNANVPQYIQETAKRYNLEVRELYQSGELWPWLVWRDETPIKLRDQTALVKYLAADPDIAFGPWRIRQQDYPHINHVRLSDPRVQVNLIAKRIYDYKSALEASNAPKLIASNDSTTLPQTHGRYEGKYQDLINAAGKKYGVDPLLIGAVMRQESAFKSGAVSHAGAMGLMQVMPATARSLGYTPDEMFVPEKSIEAGTRYLAQQLKEFNSLELALAAYNAGPNNVRKYGNAIPPFPETKNYVAVIVKKYQGIKK